MTLSPTWEWLLELAAGVCELAGHWFVQSTLLIAAGLLAGRFFYRRGPAFTSAVYRTTFVAAIVCPLVTWALSVAGMTLGITTLPELRVATIEMVAVYRVAEPAVTAAPTISTLPDASTATAPRPETAEALGAPPRPFEMGVSTRDARAALEAPPMDNVHVAGNDRVTANPFEAAPQPEAPVSPKPPTTIVEMVPTLVFNPWIAAPVGAIACVWILGTSLLLGRLAVAHLSLMRLRRTALPATAEQQQLCWTLAEKLGVWPPAMLVSPLVSSPCLAGVLRPAILLPEELPDVPLSTVFLHELAHLRRHDCFWNVVRQAVSALLFFQPLVWRLSRRLEMTAEEVCDDYVVEHGADRLTYADILVSMAERSWLRTSSAVVPLVTFRSLLGRRVARILDRTRRLSLSVSLTALALILAGGLAATVGTGALGPAGRGPTANNATTDEPDKTASSDPESAPPPADKNDASGEAGASDANLVLHYRGQVLDPNGKPAPGANVFLTFDDWVTQLDHTAKRVASTNADGWFDFRTRRIDFDTRIGTRWLSPGVVILADGFDCVQASSLAFETTGEARKRMSDVARRRADEPSVEHDSVVRLVRDDMPLTGRFVSTEGKPLAGVRVAVDRVSYNAEGNLDAWEAAARAPKADRGTLFRTLPRGGYANELSSILPAAITDRDGRFTLHGVGRERVADLVVSGENLETTPLHVRTRPGEPVMVAYQWAATPRTHEPPQIYLGNDFLQVLPHSTPVTGRVTDAQTHAPMANILVSSSLLAIRPGGLKPRISTLTDADGRYTLHGLMVGEEENLRVTPPAEESYVPLGARVTTAIDKPAVIDFALRRGVMLRGTVTEAHTGRPLEGHLSYYAFANNLSLTMHPGFIWLGSEYMCRPDERGNYQLAIPPGPGVVTFMAEDYKRFRRGAGVETITRPPRMQVGNPPTYAAVPSILVPGEKTLVQQVNPTAGDESVEVSLTPEAGATVPVRLVDSNGDAVSHVECSSTYRDGFWETVDGDTFDLLAYYPAEPRNLFFYQADRDLAAYHRLEGPAPEQLTIVLKPATSVRGRLFDESYVVKPRVRLAARDLPGTGSGDLECWTDDEGDFQVRGLVPGRTYSARAFANEVFGDLTFEAPAAAGETKDLGDVTLGPVGSIAMGENAATGTTPEKNEPAKNANGADADPVLHYRGQVLDPDGHPLAGAKILLSYYNLREHANSTAQRATTGADGWFDFSTRRADFAAGIGKKWLTPGLIVAADGCGCARRPSLDFETTGEARKRLSDAEIVGFGEEVKDQENILRLVRDDAPLTGRLVSTEGKPLAGVRVAADAIWYNAAGDLAPWEKAATEARADYYSLRKTTPLVMGFSGVTAIPPATTDADGRFTLHGIGRERIVELLISGPGLESAKLHARTRAGKTVEVPHQWRETPRDMKEIYLANDFLQVIAPSQPVVGRVTDAESGAPIAGISVSAGHRSRFLGNGKSYIATVTDEDGRYSLEGLTIGEECQLHVVPPKESAYLPVGDEVTTKSSEPATRDFTLRRGIWVTGRVTETGTGKPLDGEVTYNAFGDNPHLNDYRGFWAFRGQYGCQPDENGEYRIAVLPGSGIIGFLTRDDRFRRGAGAETITHPSTNEDGENRMYSTVPYFLQTVNKSVVRQIDLAPDAAAVTVDLSLTPGASFIGRVLDPAGKPVSGGVVCSNEMNGLWRDFDGETFDVQAYYPDQPRDLYIFQPDRNLAGFYRLSGEAPRDLTITLQPAGSVRGRAVNDLGDAAANMPLIGSAVTYSKLGKWDLRYSTDDDGRFHIRGLVAGQKYTVSARDGAYDRGRIFVDLTVEAGETRDLGDVRLTFPPPKKTTTSTTPGKTNSTSGAPTSESKTSGDKSSAAAEKPLVLTGQVLAPDGRPVAGAAAVLQGHRWDYMRVAPSPDRATTDTDGNFHLDVRNTQNAGGEPRDWRLLARLVAYAPGYGMAGIPYSEIGPDHRAVIRLVPDEPIEGRIVDLEGHPVVGAKIDIKNVATNHGNELTAWLAALRTGTPYHGSQERGLPDIDLNFDGDPPGDPSIPGAKTDADGRFRITGIGRHRFVRLGLSGGGAVTADMLLVTLPMAEFKMHWAAEKDPMGATTLFGSQFQFTAEPSQPIEGTVRDATTGEPLPHVRVWSDKYSTSDLGADYQVKTESDDAGRYRLEGMPRGKGNRIVAIPADDQPYFMRDFDVPAVEGLAPVKCDLDLHRGVMISGKIAEQKSGRPVRGRLYYIPRPDNPHIVGLPEFNSQNLPGPQLRYQVAEDGTYKIVGLPGRGYVCLWAVDDRPCPSGQGLDKILDLPKAEEFRPITHVFEPTASIFTMVKEVRPGEKDAQATLDFEVSNGETVALNLVDAAGQPVSGAQVWGLWPRQQFHIEKDTGANVQVVGLRPDEKRRILVHHKERNIGCAMMVCAQDLDGAPATAKLVPCASVTARLVDREGDPVAFGRIGFDVTGEGNFGLGFPDATTDADGRFTVNNVLTGCTWDIVCRAPVIEIASIANALSIAPGEQIDLGEINVSEDARPEPKRTPADQVAAADEPRVLRGRVVGPSNEGIADARILVLGPHLRARTGADGRFEVLLKRTRLAGDTTSSERSSQTFVMAAAAGYGLAYASTKDAKPGEELSLKMVADEPIDGHVVDLEGRPIAGMQVRLESLEVSQADDPAAWIDELHRNPHATPSLLKIMRRDLPLASETTTSADGRFRFEGLGCDRGATLLLSGSGVAAHTIKVITREGEPIRVEPPPAARLADETYYGAKFQYAADPSHPIEGIVRDAASGEPLAGVRVISRKYAGQQRNAYPQVGAVSGEDGHYRLDGMPRGTGNQILAVSSKSQPYFAREFDVPTGDNFAPIKLDLDLRRGVWITGRVTLEQTGAPVRAQLKYLPWPDNPTIKDWPEFHRRYLADHSEVHATDNNGHYRIVGLPGRGLIEVIATGQVPIPTGQGIAAIPDLPSDEEFKEISQLHVPRGQNVTAVKDVRVKAGQEVATVDFALAGGTFATGGKFAAGGKQMGAQAKQVVGTAQSDSKKSTGTFVPASAVPAKPRPTDSGEDLIRVAGRVIDPSGQAAAGVEVLALRYHWQTWEENAPVAKTKTDATGRFQLEFRKSQLPDSEYRGWRHALIAAVAPGFGPAWVKYEDIPAGEEPTLRLVADEPITGRVVDLEGRPLRDVQVVVQNLRGNKKNDLTQWLDEVRAAAASGNKGSTYAFIAGSQRKTDMQADKDSYTANEVLPTDVAPLLFRAKTDADGRFRIMGVGHDRIASLKLAGGGIVLTQLQVATRPMEPIEDSGSGFFNTTLYGSKVEYSAEPCQPIEGVVRNAKTHQPIPNVRILSDTFATVKVGGLHVLDTLTDNEGRYRLEGMPKGKGNKIVAMPGDDQPYFIGDFDVPTADGIEPVKFDIELHRGVWVSGRLTSATTGRAVFGHLYYVPWADNPHVQGLPEFRGHAAPMLQVNRYPTDADGNFRLVGMAGHGLVTVRTSDDRPYPQGQGLREIKELPSPDQFSRVGTLFPPTRSSPTAAAEINPTEQDEDFKINITLVDGLQVPLELLDPEGKPLTGVTARGVWPVGQNHEENDVGPKVNVVALWPDEHRLVFLHHDQRKLGKAIRVNATANEPGPVQVKLEPCATVTAQLIDGEGEPLSGAVIRFEVTDPRGQGLYWETTDADGRFTNTMVPAGCEFEVHCQAPQARFVTLAKGLSVVPGETIDLGKIDVTADPRPEIKRTPVAEKSVPKKDVSSAKDEPRAMSGSKLGSSGVTLTLQIDSNADRPATDDSQTGKPLAVVTSEPLPPDAKTATVQGRVVDADGQPIAGADVAVIAMHTKTEPGGFLSSSAETPAAGNTDADGRFVLDFPRLSSKTHGTAHVIARSSGRGLGFVKLKPDDGKFDVAIQLLPEETIHGRIVDVDGQPGTGVQIRLNSIVPAQVREVWNWWTESVSYTEAEVPPAAWPTVPTTDAEGRFVIHGVPQNHGVYLSVPGNEQFAPQEVRLNAGETEQRADNDATYRPKVKNVASGEEVVLALAPAQWFEGMVRYKDTNEPAPHAKVSIWASQEEYGSMSSVHGKTDATGHYRISANPGIRFGVNCIAPVGTPYLNHKTSLDKPIDWQTGERKRTVDITLPRGVLVRGTIVDARSGEPIVGASVQYIPESGNNPNDGEDILTGWQNMQSSDDDGKFQIAVLPGPGRLLVHGPDGSYILREIGAQELQKSKRGGQRNYAHAIQKVDPQAGQDPLDVRITLERGATIQGHIVDEQGAPVDDVLVVTGLDIRPFWLTWHGTTSAPTKGNEFELAGLEANHEYSTFFLEPNRRLGAVVKLKATDVEPKIVLHPCVKAKARFVTPDGAPKQGMHPGLHLVVKPGGFAYNSIAQRMGELAADSDYVANIDRVNYLHQPSTDDDGRVVFPALIPGATYRLLGARKGNLTMERDFVVPAAQTLDLGDITYDDERN